MRAANGSSLRAPGKWIVRWVMLASLIGIGLVAWTVLGGGSIHRTPVCGGRDANIYALALLSGAVAAVLLIGGWAISPSAGAHRFLRFLLIALAVPAIVAVAMIGVLGVFTMQCMGGAGGVG